MAKVTNKTCPFSSAETINHIFMKAISCLKVHSVYVSYCTVCSFEKHKERNNMPQSHQLIGMQNTDSKAEQETFPAYTEVICGRWRQMGCTTDLSPPLSETMLSSASTSVELTGVRSVLYFVPVSMGFHHPVVMGSSRMGHQAHR